MSLSISVLIALFGASLLAASLMMSRGSDQHVTNSLLDDSDSAEQEEGVVLFSDELEENIQERRKAWFIGALLCVVIRLVFFSFSFPGVIVAVVIGGFAGELFYSRKRENRKALRLRKMDFYLPTVMERIVMAVGSGLDIIPALREAGRGGRDPISELFRWIVTLSERGTPVEEAFELASKQNVTPSVKHACIHLGLAYRQGGEIVRPLKELSDATQVAYQEGVEEHIAKLPVKAVLPIVLTFTGLIVCFLTVPLMQVGSITKKVVDASAQQ